MPVKGVSTAAVVAVVLAWGTPLQPAVAGGQDGPVKITVEDNRFDPRDREVNAKVVRWNNRGDNRHTVTSVRDGLFHHVLDPGEFFRIRFTTLVPGVYKYFCRIHDNMRGKFRLIDPTAPV
jgi:plastocyanin